MKLYPKMQTLYKRNMDTHKIMPGVFSRAEFENINEWQLTEKIDGMNIRIEYKDDSHCNGPLVSFAGRTINAILTDKMLSYLGKNFKCEIFDEVFFEAHNIMLFGEGYGGGIQKGGGLYREDNGFILFDVYLDGWWLKRESIENIAYDLGLKCVPIIPGTTIEDAIAYVLSKPQSIITKTEKMAEGVVARSAPLMLFRNGNMMAWKLKVKDYIELGVIDG